MTSHEASMPRSWYRGTRLRSVLGDASSVGRCIDMDDACTFQVGSEPVDLLEKLIADHGAIYFEGLCAQVDILYHYALGLSIIGMLYYFYATPTSSRL